MDLDGAVEMDLDYQNDLNLNLPLPKQSLENSLLHDPMDTALNSNIPNVLESSYARTWVGWFRGTKMKEKRCA